MYKFEVESNINPNLENEALFELPTLILQVRVSRVYKYRCTTT